MFYLLAESFACSLQSNCRRKKKKRQSNRICWKVFHEEYFDYFPLPNISNASLNIGFKKSWIFSNIWSRKRNLLLLRMLYFLEWIVCKVRTVGKWLQEFIFFDNVIALISVLQSVISEIVLLQGVVEAAGESWGNFDFYRGENKLWI